MLQSPLLTLPRPLSLAHALATPGEAAARVRAAAHAAHFAHRVYLLPYVDLRNDRIDPATRMWWLTRTGENPAYHLAKLAFVPRSPLGNFAVITSSSGSRLSGGSVMARPAWPGPRRTRPCCGRSCNRPGSGTISCTP